ncbi:hypothetical protein BC937DRAFT_88389 [Endogone sp. FLAS-F59071]|nr:hypothetical protein BC937DRAFT_88389 [Endogone sp. FLAS-F59071]|eukprot:RUS18754.1 hypothetical protein BC937DRAFT_88389 [Endogone sp. FLAS-F59071]
MRRHAIFGGTSFAHAMTEVMNICVQAKQFLTTVLFGTGTSSRHCEQAIWWQFAGPPAPTWFHSRYVVWGSL